MKKVYICEKCYKQHDDELGAKGCEEGHRGIKGCKVFAVRYLDDRFRNYPSKLRVHFSERREDFATYKLDHIGYKGI